MHSKDPARVRELLAKLRADRQGQLVLLTLNSPTELSKVLKLVQCLANNYAQDVPFQSILSELATVEKGVNDHRRDHLEPALEELKPRLEGIKISQHASDDHELDEVSTGILLLTNSWRDG